MRNEARDLQAQDILRTAFAMEIARPDIVPAKATVDDRFEVLPLGGIEYAGRRANLAPIQVDERAEHRAAGLPGIRQKVVTPDRYEAVARGFARDSAGRASGVYFIGQALIKRVSILGAPVVAQFFETASLRAQTTQPARISVLQRFNLSAQPQGGG